MAPTDREVLLQLFHTTGGPSWTRHEGWGEENDLNDWFGVKANDDGRVYRLNLSNNNLRGEIPKELGGLPVLKTLDLSWNQLSGEIPTELGNLQAIQDLQLWGNQLTGEIPKELGNLQAIQTLELFKNRLTGEIPTELGNLQAIQDLRLWGNQLTGEIPTELGNLQAIRVLKLGTNQLTGEIPTELGNLQAIQDLQLWRNQLTGAVPEALGNIESLRMLELWGNTLSGPLPETIRRHKYFSTFNTGVPLDDGPALPNIIDGTKRILILPLVLAYLDLGSDVYTAETYHREGHNYWFFLVLFFAIAPPFIVAAFFLPHESWCSKFRIVTHTSLMYEAYASILAFTYSPTLALLRVVEPLFESLPQAFLQLYALLVTWDETVSSLGTPVIRLFSVSFSVISLAYAATDFCSVNALAVYDESLMCQDSSEACTQSLKGTVSKTLTDWLGGCNTLITSFFRACTVQLTGCCSSVIPQWCGGCFKFVTSFFPPSRCMTGRAGIKLAGFGSIGKGVYFWLCFVYHIMEITSRFLSLALVAVAMDVWTFLLLAVLFAIRCVLVHCVPTVASPSVPPSDGSHHDKHTRRCTCFPELSFGMKVRLVATPFLDSIFERALAYKVAICVTMVEFTAFLMASALLPRDSNVIPPTARAIFSYIAIGAFVAKMILALWVILPLKVGASQVTARKRPIEADRDGAMGLSQAAVDERPVSTTCNEEEGMCQSAVKERPVATNSAERAAICDASAEGRPIAVVNTDEARMNAEEGPVVTNSDGQARVSQAAVVEPPVATVCSEDTTMSKAAGEERPVAAGMSQGAMERGDLGRAQPQTTGSATIWGEKDDEAAEGQL